MSVRILRGDVREMLATLPDESVHCCVTSPPYYGLRDYGVPGQLGLEPTLAEYLDNMVSVFREVRRVLRSDGTLWLNIGDSYARTGGTDRCVSATAKVGSTRNTLEQMSDRTSNAAADGLKSKDLMGVPWRLAFALQADGWYLRSDIIWHKKSTMPESVRDRPTKSHEHIFLLAKSESYYYDQVAASEPVSESFAKDSRHVTGSNENNDKEGYEAAGAQNPKGPHSVFEKWSFLNRHGGELTRNWRDVWSLGPEPFKEAHFATFPTEIPRRAIVAGCPITGTVLDPFLGSGTTALVADRLQRHCIGIELNPAYADMAERRIRGDAPLFAEVA